MTAKSPAKIQTLALGEVVYSFKIGDCGPFTGIIDSVHRNRDGGVFYNVLDNEGNSWHRLAIELKSVGENQDAT